MTAKESEKDYSVSSDVCLLVQWGMAGCQWRHFSQCDTGNGHIQAALHGGLLWVTTGCTMSQNCGTCWILGSLSHYLLSWSQAPVQSHELRWQTQLFQSPVPQMQGDSLLHSCLRFWMLPSLFGSTERGEKKGQAPTTSWSCSVFLTWKATGCTTKKKTKNPRILNHFAIFVSVKKLWHQLIMVTHILKELINITALTIGTPFWKINVELCNFN